MKINNTSTIVILSHFYKRTTAGGGPPQEVRNYFLPKVKKLIYIEHPFPYADDHRSSMTIYESEKITKQIFTPPLNGPQVLFYIIDIFITWYFLIKAKTKVDLCVALDNLNTVSVIPFKKLRIIKKLVFYCIDYTPLRFSNKLLNFFYHFVDKIAVYNTDVIWVLSMRMKIFRRKNGIDDKKSARSILLPMGANLTRIKPLPFNKIKNKQLIFVGHLLEKQGLQLFIQALPGILKKVPGVKLIIVGQGEYKQTLVDLVKRLHLGRNVTFKGFVKTHEEVEKILCQSGIGIALYKPTDDNYTYYTDPGKPKLYLACGLPVVITNIPESARIIQKNKAGVIVDYNKKSVEKMIIHLLKNEKDYRKYRENAIKLSESYDTNTLIAKAIQQI